jgi:hypothetical protein
MLWRQILTAATLFMAFVSYARAQTITYKFVDYPVNEVDLYNAGYDRISGTIITDGTLGSLSRANIVGGTLNIDYPVGSCFSNLATSIRDGGTFLDTMVATPAELTVYGSSASYSQFFLSVTSYQGPAAASITIGYSAGYYWGGDPFYSCEVLGPSMMTRPAGFRAVVPPAQPGSIAASYPWVVATVVPEPTTLVLLGIGAAVLACYCWGAPKAGNQRKK